MQKKLNAYLILLHLLLAPLPSFTPLFFTPFFSTHFHLLSLFLFTCFLHKFSHLISSLSFVLFLNFSFTPPFLLSSSILKSRLPLLSSSHQFSTTLLLAPHHTFFSSLLLLTFHSFLIPLIIFPPLVPFPLLLHRFSPVLPSSLSDSFSLLACP